MNQNGLIQANSVRERKGVIELLATDSVNLGADSVITANGDSAAVSAGGQITIKGGNHFTDAQGSQISVAGGGLGGNGGFAEISADEISGIQSQIDGHAVAGSTGGRLLIDPNNITIGNTGSGSAGSGTVGSGSPPATGTLSLNVNSAFTGFSQIDLQARNNITITSGVYWDLVASTGINAPGSLLRLEAGNNLTIGSGASIVGGAGWSVSLEAGRDFTSASAIRSGIRNIVFTGTGSLETSDGNIQLLAGNNITVNAGYVHTTGGGGINAYAVAGSINTGTRRNAFFFGESGAQVDVYNLGGISTANGGNVTLLAGADVTSYLPTLDEISLEDGGFGGGSGAFGSAAGNVTIAAGGNVSGHFVEVNGTGRIFAGVKRDANGNLLQDAAGNYILDATSIGSAGTPIKSLALSLVSGGWTVNAARDILLQEVRNPNGLFNDVGFGSSTTRHNFDYAPDAYVNLISGNSVQLLGDSLPRYTDFERGITPIYPGTLNISTGAGGVILGNNVTMAPSPIGNLTITTTGGGSLQTRAYADYLLALADYYLHQFDSPPPTRPSAPADQWQLLVSDSGRTQYHEAGDFGIADHAAVPIHLNDLEPIRLNISGSMNGILLGAPKHAEITVQGDMVNSRFDGQNLHATDVTSIHVGGDIQNRNEFTTAVVSTTPRFAVFDLVYPPLPNNLAGLGNLFSYNATTHELTFQGRMTGDQLDALLNLRVRTFDANGIPILDANGQPVTAPAHFVSDAVINELYTASQDVPLNPNTGYVLGGGGTFDLRAHNLDLGSTIGIVSQGPRANSALANYFTHGADINVTLTGNLDMFSTKIASLNGGDINVSVGGSANLGSRTFLSSDSEARGIFTADRNDVTLVAGGDINVNGSRIAAYDGGNVVVRSLHGNIDAGTGLGGAARVERIYVDPITRVIYTYTPTIPGSGILATTFPPSLDPRFPHSPNTVGNILIEAREGNITASAGGIVQIPLNHVRSAAATVTLLAGYQALAGTTTPVFSLQNLVSDLSLASSGHRLKLVDKDGQPVLDAQGHPIYVSELLDANVNTVFTDDSHINAATLSKILSDRRQKLMLVDAADHELLDASGSRVFVTQLNDASHAPQFVIGRNIDVSGTGVIGSNVKLEATGNINGLAFARNNLDITAQQNVNVTALALGNATVNAGEDLAGTIIGVGSVSASGAAVEAALLSQNVVASGDVTSSQVGFAQGNAAGSTSQSQQNGDAEKVAKPADDTGTDDPSKKKKGIALAQKVSRVTVLLPPKP